MLGEPKHLVLFVGRASSHDSVAWASCPWIQDHGQDAHATSDERERPPYEEQSLRMYVPTGISRCHSGLPWSSDHVRHRDRRQIVADQAGARTNDQREAIRGQVAASARPVAITPGRQVRFMPGLSNRHRPGRGIRLQDDLAVLIVRRPEGPAILPADLERQDPEVLIVVGRRSRYWPRATTGAISAMTSYDGLGVRSGRTRPKLSSLYSAFQPSSWKSYHQRPLNDGDVRASRYSRARYDAGKLRVGPILADVGRPAHLRDVERHIAALVLAEHLLHAGHPRRSTPRGRAAGICRCSCSCGSRWRRRRRGHPSLTISSSQPFLTPPLVQAPAITVTPGSAALIRG